MSGAVLKLMKCIQDVPNAQVDFAKLNFTRVQYALKIRNFGLNGLNLTIVLLSNYILLSAFSIFHVVNFKNGPCRSQLAFTSGTRYNL